MQIFGSNIQMFLKQWELDNNHSCDVVDKRKASGWTVLNYLIEYITMKPGIAFLRPMTVGEGAFHRPMIYLFIAEAVDVCHIFFGVNTFLRAQILIIFFWILLSLIIKIWDDIFRNHDETKTYANTEELAKSFVDIWYNSDVLPLNKLWFNRCFTLQLRFDNIQLFFIVLKDFIFFC